MHSCSQNIDICLEELSKRAQDNAHFMSSIKGLVNALIDFRTQSAAPALLNMVVSVSPPQQPACSPRNTSSALSWPSMDYLNKMSTVHLVKQTRTVIVL